VTYTASVRKGVAAASRLHRDLGTETRVRHEGGRIDVSGAAAAVGLSLLFRPLEGLLGAFIRAPQPGALVTTQRPLAIQRFTAAHELGHFMLGHDPSLDDENVLRRAAIPNSGLSLQEVEADAFAVEFMLPRWLFQFHCEKQGWRLDDLLKPPVVYQLSLRLGASYEATARTMFRHKLIDNNVVEQLLAATPRALKKDLLGDYAPPDFRGDVWLLTRRDTDAPIDGSHNDLFVFRLQEHSGAGYLWTFNELDSLQLAIVRDLREHTDEGDIGEHVQRIITTRSNSKQRGKLKLLESRPWQPDQPLHQLSIRYDLMGPEEGLSQAERRQRLAA
jgi:Zn-dependent peptidase ImmA (M78 family)